MEIRPAKKKKKNAQDKHDSAYFSLTKRSTKTGGKLVKPLGIVPLGKVSFNFQTNTGKYQSFIISGQQNTQPPLGESELQALSRPA